MRQAGRRVGRTAGSSCGGGASLARHGPLPAIRLNGASGEGVRPNREQMGVGADGIIAPSRDRACPHGYRGASRLTMPAEANGPRSPVAAVGTFEMISKLRSRTTETDTHEAKNPLP